MQVSVYFFSEVMGNLCISYRVWRKTEERSEQVTPTKISPAQA